MGSPVISVCLPEGDEQEDNSADLDNHQSEPDELKYFSELYSVKYQDALKESFGTEMHKGRFS